MEPNDKFLIVAKRAGAAIDPMQKVHFRSTLPKAEETALSILRRLSNGFNGNVRGVQWEVCIFELRFVETVKPAANCPTAREAADRQTLLPQ